MKGYKFQIQAFIGSGFYTGYFPFAPATVTSLFALVPAYYLTRLPLLSILLVIAVFFLGVWVAGDLEQVLGKDPPQVTIDEIAGTFITFFYNPVSILGLTVGFILWRGFDILKLPFVDRVQRLKGGWGVMMDDVLAGICANLVLRLLLFILPPLRG